MKDLQNVKTGLRDLKSLIGFSPLLLFSVLSSFSQDVFLMIRRHKTTIFTDAKESTTVYELKRIVEGILKRPPEEQRLYKDDMLLEDSKTLGDCGFTNQTARPQAPATVGLAFRISVPAPLADDGCPKHHVSVTKDYDVVVPDCHELTQNGSVIFSEDAFEPLRVEPFSTPPELPDVMKPQDSGSTANEQAVQ
ncbi:hypothetical protein NFI96_022836 [Prochilodus magdalenae]|nr:hypothetical protein NFI96_022836 [Prochilodus magdalenae]